MCGSRVSDVMVFEMWSLEGDCVSCDWISCECDLCPYRGEPRVFLHALPSHEEIVEKWLSVDTKGSPPPLTIPGICWLLRLGTPQPPVLTVPSQ